MIDIDLEGRNSRDLIILKEQVMRSELPYNNKSFLISKIDGYLGIRYSREDVIADIKAGSADIDDINE